MANPIAWLKSFFGGNIPDAAKSADGLLTGLLSGSTTPRRGTYELLQAYNRLPWLHAVIQRLAFDVSRIRWRMYRVPTGAAVKARSKAFRTQRRGWMGYAPEGAKEVDHPFLNVLTDPNPVVSPMATWWVMQGLLDVKGECPVIIERDGSGNPIEFWPLPPHWLIETPTTQRPNFRFQVGTWARAVDPSNVLYLRHPALDNPYGRGVGTGEAAADELDIDEFAAKHLKSFFYNRALPDAFLSVEGLSDEKRAREFEERIRAKHQGNGKANQIHVVNAKIDVKQLGGSFRDSQVVELRGAQRDLFLQLFSVPPEVMGIIENSNRATIDAADYLYQKNTICPRADFLADSFTHALGEPGLVVGYESPVPADDEFNLKVMVAQPTLFTKNEWRGMASAEPREGWDEEFPAAPSLSSPFGGTSPSSLPSGDAEDPAEEAADDEEADPTQARRFLPRGFPRRVAG